MVSQIIPESCNRAPDMSVGESGALDHCSPLGICESGKDMQTDGILKIVDLAVHGP